MSVHPGIGFAAFLNAFLLVALLGVLVFLYWRAMPIHVDNRLEAWNEEATSLAREVQRTADDTNVPIDYDRLQRQLVPLASRLKGHARSAPRTVNERVTMELHELGMNCYKVGMEHSTIQGAQSGDFLEDRLDDLQGTAERVEATVSTYPEPSDHCGTPKR